MAESLGQPRERMLVGLAEGRLALRQGDLPKAQARIEAALAQAERAGALELQRQATLQLSLVHEAAGRHAAALEAFRHHKALSDRIYDEERTKRLDALDRRYQAERRELELESLRRQQAEQGLQIGEERTKRHLLLAAFVALALVFGAFLVRRRELQAINRRLAELSLTDQLTGLGNRRRLEDTLGTDLPMCLRRGADGQRPPERDLVALLIDIDHFKAVNDQRGHAIGDRVLVRLAEVLRANCRASDVLVRWGGEEFLVLQRFVDREQAPVLAARLAAAIRDTTVAEGDEPPLSITCSIGFAAFPMTADATPADWTATVALADEALYIAKSRRDAWVGVLRATDAGARVAVLDPRAALRGGRFEIVSSFVPESGEGARP